MTNSENPKRNITNINLLRLLFPINDYDYHENVLLLIVVILLVLKFAEFAKAYDEVMNECTSNALEIVRCKLHCVKIENCHFNELHMSIVRKQFCV